MNYYAPASSIQFFMNFSALMNIILFRKRNGEPMSSSSSESVGFLTISIYPQKLLLSDIAKELELSLYYLSHFFKANFGISFQDYLARIRSEKARQLLLLTRQSLLDISISAGFSDPKYFNASFKKQYGCTPKEYRRQFKHAQLPDQQISMLTTQEFLSEEAGLILLDQFMIRE